MFKRNNLKKAFIFTSAFTINPWVLFKPAYAQEKLCPINFL